MSYPAQTPLLTLDIGGTTTRAAFMVGQQIIQRLECPTPQPAYPEAVLASAVALARPLAGACQAVGVACAGAVIGGRVTATAEHTFPGWQDIALAEQLSAALQRPCTVLNDARAAAWGEAQAGAGQGCPDFMFMTISTGVGAGLVLGGQLHLAANGLDAEIGFSSVPAQWHTGYAVPGLGRLGPLEFESSGTALNQRATVLGYADAKALCDAAEAGAETAEQEYQHSAALVAWKIADIAALLGISRVALGGSVGLRPGYLERVQQALSHFPVRYQPQVLPALLGADAGLIGAGVWASQQVAKQ